MANVEANNNLCSVKLSNYISQIPHEKKATRADVKAALFGDNALPQFSACKNLPEVDQYDLLNQHFQAPSSEVHLRRTQLGIAYRKDTDDVMYLRYRMWWRGVVAIGIVVLVLCFVLYSTVLQKSKTSLYVIGCILLGYIGIVAVRTLYLYGIAGIGARFGHILNGSAIQLQRDASIPIRSSAMSDASNRIPVEWDG